MRGAELLQQRAEQQERVAVLAADILAVDEHPRIHAQRVPHAHHHGIEERAPLRVARRVRLERRQRRIDVDGGPPRRLEHLDPRPPRLVRGHAFARGLGRRPRRVDDQARLLLHGRFRLAQRAIRVAGREDTVRLEARSVDLQRVARAPESIQPRIGVALFRQGRIRPRRLRIAPQVEHVVVVCVPAHPHAHQLDQRRPFSLSRAFHRPAERARDLVRIGTVDRDARNPVARGLVGERAHGRLICQRGRERRLVVLHAEDRRQSPRGAQVDRFVPLAERRSSFADERQRDASVALLCERHREPRDGERAGREGRRRRQDARLEVAEMQILAVHRRTRLRHLRREHHPHRLAVALHRERGAQIANQRRDDVAAPAARGSIRLPAAQPDAGGVDRLLPERTESLPLKRRLSVPHFAAEEERLQAIVRCARERHASEDLEPLVPRQRSLDGDAAQKTVAGVDQFFNRLRPPRSGVHPRRRLGQPGWRRRQRASKRRRQLGPCARDVRFAREIASDRLQRRHRGGHGKGISIEHERAEARCDRRLRLDGDPVRHGQIISHSMGGHEGTDRSGWQRRSALTVNLVGYSRAHLRGTG